MAAVVADASVLIALAQIDRLSLLEQLFGEVMIPPAVAREVSPGLPELPFWVRPLALGEPTDARLVAASLDAGETEAIPQVHGDRGALTRLARSGQGRLHGRDATSTGREAKGRADSSL